MPLLQKGFLKRAQYRDFADDPSIDEPAQEKSWRIEEERPIPVEIHQHWSGDYIVKVQPGLMTYETWQHIDQNHRSPQDLGVSSSSYDYEDGSGSFNIIRENRSGVKNYEDAVSIVDEWIEWYDGIIMRGN